MRLPLLALLLVLLAACAEQPVPAAGPQPDLMTYEDSARALEAGVVATQVAQGLVQRLQGALAADGPVAAIDFCSQRALVLTDSMAAAAALDATVKRTSLRLRNPDNAPDSLEQVVLLMYDSVQSAGGTLPSYFLQAADQELRYYRPLMVQEFCLQCHGPVTGIAPEVHSVIQQRYPVDDATGYQAGDWRGLIRVSVPRY